MNVHPEHTGDSDADPAEQVSPEAPAGRRFAWWHGLRPLTRRAIRVGAALFMAVLVSAGFGVATASYTGSLGPHVAEYSTRLNGEVRVDMGPLGSLVIDSPLPASLGVNVWVREIPDQLSTTGAQDPVDGLLADLNSYTQFLVDPQPTIDDAARGLVQDAVGRAVVTLSVLLMAIALSRLAAHGVLREAAKSAWRQPGVPFVASTLVVVLVVLPISDLTRGFGLEGRSSAVLADTPLEDARITGRLATIVDYYGAMVVRAVDDNAQFYADVNANLLAAYQADAHPVAPPDRRAPAAADEEENDEEVDDEEEDDDDTTDEGSSPEQQEQPRGGDPTQMLAFTDPDAEYATFLMVADLHCNVGMAAVIGTAAEVAEVDAVLNAGDTVMSGTSVESYCVNAFADGIDSDLPVIVADGNHDSTLTAEQERARGWTVLEGDLVEVAGVRILGDTDPTLTEMGTGTRLERDETVTEMGARLRDQLCEIQDEDDEPVDILLVHSPHAARASLEAGCVPLSLSGHMHSQAGPRQFGLGVQYVSGSTAGATLGQPTVGPLQGQAAMTVIRWNLTTGEPAHYRLIHAEIDAAVELGPWTNFPAQPEQFVEPPAPPEPDIEEPDVELEEGDPSEPDQNLPEDEEAIED